GARAEGAVATRKGSPRAPPSRSTSPRSRSHAAEAASSIPTAAPDPKANAVPTDEAAPPRLDTPEIPARRTEPSPPKSLARKSPPRVADVASARKGAIALYRSALGLLRPGPPPPAA